MKIGQPPSRYGLNSVNGGDFSFGNRPRKIDARLPCKFNQSVGEGDPFEKHHEPDDIPTCVAAETVEDLPGGVDHEGRGFFLVKGAQALEVGARPLQFQVSSDHIHDVAGLLDPGNGIFVETHRINPGPRGQRPKEMSRNQPFSENGKTGFFS